MSLLFCRRDRAAPTSTTVSGIMSSVGAGLPASAGPPPTTTAAAPGLVPSSSTGVAPPLPSSQPMAPQPAASQQPPASQNAPGSTLNIGDMVQVAAQENNVKQLQRGHGEWADSMKQVNSSVEEAMCAEEQL